MGAEIINNSAIEDIIYLHDKYGYEVEINDGLIRKIVIREDQA